LNNSSSLNRLNFLANLSSLPSSCAVTLTTEDEVDISRGDVIVHTNALPRVSNSLKVMIVWMDEKPMDIFKTYDIKCATSVIPGNFEHINYKVDVNTYERIQVKKLELNDIASCKMVLSRPIPVDKYKENRQTGSFIVIDRVTNNTVGAGMIVDVSKRYEDKVVKIHREYTEAEKALNEYIRTHFPEWGCKEI
jgi:sulfate adenylyltransferase subunit 1